MLLIESAGILFIVLAEFIWLDPRVWWVQAMQLTLPTGAGGQPRAAEGRPMAVFLVNALYPGSLEQLPEYHLISFGFS